MDPLQRASVTLLIWGDGLIPSEVTKLLGKDPEFGVRKGERFFARHGREVEAPTGKWNFGEGWRSPPNIDQQISELFSALPDDMDLWADLTKRFDCWVTIGAYLDGWTGGLVLKPTTLSLLADRGLAFDLDIYAPAASD